MASCLAAVCILQPVFYSTFLSSGNGHVAMSPLFVHNFALPHELDVILAFHLSKRISSMKPSVSSPAPGITPEVVANYELTRERDSLTRVGVSVSTQPSSITL